MKTYLFRFMTNYEEGGIIIVTSKGLEWAKVEANRLSAWDTNDVEIIKTWEEEFITSVNFNIK